MKYYFLRLCTVVFLGSAVFANVHADNFPDKPINIIVGQAPGGSADVNARLLGESLSKILKQPVIVQNKPGVGGAISGAQVANSPPDGYTLLLTQAGTFTYPDAEKNLGHKPLYESNQIEPLVQMTDDPTILIVRTDSRWKTYQDLINEAKANPGKLTYGSSGNLGPSHLSVEMLANAAGVKFTQVPFNGGGPANMAMLAGTVDFSVAPPSIAIPQINAGKARALLNSGSRRIKVLPDVPTYKEAGFAAQFSFSTGIALPRGTPPAIQSILRDAIRAAVQTPEYISKVGTQSMEVNYLDTNAFKSFIAEDSQRILSLVEKLAKVDQR
jgi:tripartite-type tricarboxylate transporter receptor subunit TctC